MKQYHIDLIKRYFGFELGNLGFVPNDEAKCNECFCKVDFEYDDLLGHAIWHERLIE